MTQITIQVPDTVAAQVIAAKLWLPTILELNFTHFQTRAATTGSRELLDLLTRNPSAQEVADFQCSRRLQRKMNRLRALNSAGHADEAAQREIDEWGRLLHIATMLTLKGLKYRKRI